MSRKNLLVPLILVSFFLSLFYQGDLLTGSLRMGEDLLSIHYPQQLAASEGDVSPSYRFGPGLDLLSEGQTGILSPVNALLRMWELPQGFLVATLFCQFMAFWGMGFLLRQRGLSFRATLIGMITYGASLFVLTKVEHWMNFQALCFLPMAVYGQERSDIKGVLIMGVLTGFALLAGAQQYVWIAFLILLLNCWLQNQMHWKQLTLAGVLGVALAAPQLMATLQQLMLSERSSGVDSFQHSLPVKHLLGIFMSHPLGAPAQENYLGGGPFWEFALFSGVVSLVLLKWASRKYLFVMVGALLLALGSAVPVVSTIHELFPFKLFRVPARYLMIFVFFMALAAAHGFDRVRFSEESSPKILKCLSALAAVFLMLFLLVGCTSIVEPCIAEFWEGTVMPTWKDRLEQSEQSLGYFTRAFISMSRGLLIQLFSSLSVLVMTLIFLRRKQYDFMILLLLIETMVASYMVRDTIEYQDLLDNSLLAKVQGAVLIPEAHSREQELSVCEGEHRWQERYLARRPFVSAQLKGEGISNPLHHSPLHSTRVKHWQSLLKQTLNPNLNTPQGQYIQERGQRSVFTSFLYQRANIRHVMERNTEGEWAWRKVSLSIGQGVPVIYEGNARETSEPLYKRMLSQSPQYSLEFDDKQVLSELKVPRQSTAVSVELNGKYKAGWVRFPSYRPAGWMADVDGLITEIVPVDYVASAVKVPAGAKRVTLIQQSVMPYWVLIVSLVAWVLSLGLWLLVSLKALKQNKKETQIKTS